MITPSDSSYKATKKIMLGKARMNKHFQALSDWIQRTYAVRPVNIIYDLAEEGKLPRLEICFEYKAEEALFSNKDGYSYNKNKQEAIAKKFQQLIREQGLEKKKGLLHTLIELNSKYITEDVWVIFSGFNKIAMAEANESIPSEAINQLKQQLSEEGLWEISCFFDYTTFFVHTQKQVKELENSDTLKRWTDLYFQLLKQYDTFDYFQKETFSLLLDSKENFMNNYQGNWYYYYK